MLDSRLADSSIPQCGIHCLYAMVDRGGVACQFDNSIMTPAVYVYAPFQGCVSKYPRTLQFRFNALIGLGFIFGSFQVGERRN